MGAVAYEQGICSPVHEAVSRPGPKGALRDVPRAVVSICPPYWCASPDPVDYNIIYQANGSVAKPMALTCAEPSHPSKGGSHTWCTFVHTEQAYRGTSLIKKRPPPQDHRRALGTGLLLGPRMVRFFVREANL